MAHECVICGSTTSHAYVLRDDVTVCFDCHTCVKCLANDALQLDPFKEIYDAATGENISMKLCKDCLTLIRCKTCHAVSDEPWWKYKFDLTTAVCECQQCTPITTVCNKGTTNTKALFDPK